MVTTRNTVKKLLILSEIANDAHIKEIMGINAYLWSMEKQPFADVLQINCS